MNKKTQEKPAHKSAPAYTRAQLETAARYAGRRDLIRALLEDGACCTLEELDGRIDAYLKGKVK